MNLESSRYILEKKKIRISDFMKICPMGAELSHADGRRDTTMLVVDFAILRTRRSTRI